MKKIKNKFKIFVLRFYNDRFLEREVIRIKNISIRKEILSELDILLDFLSKTKKDNLKINCIENLKIKEIIRRIKNVE